MAASFLSKALLVAAIGTGASASRLQARDCTFSIVAYASDTCASMAFDWAITLDQFIAWNPQVGAGCSKGLVTGQSYCVEVDFGQNPPVTTAASSTAKSSSTTKPPTTTSKATSSTKTSSTTAAPTGPTPVQEGITEKCSKYHLVVDGDTCDSIRAKYNFLAADFYAWNPAIGGVSCSGLWKSYYVCVGIPGSVVTTPAPTPTVNPNQPSPVQDGISQKCSRWHLVSDGDTCDSIRAKYNFLAADFYAWNPAVGGTACSGLWKSYYVCVSVPGATTTTPAPTPTNNAPGPTQSGVASNCNRWHKILAGDTCEVIRAKYNTFSVADFLKWNPAAGADCSGLWKDYFACIGVPGTPTTPTTAPPAGPSPTQTGMPSNCKKYYQVVSGDYCQKVADTNKITLANFLSWNPAIGGSACQGLWLGYYYCVQV